MVACKSADTFVDPLIEKLKSTTFFGRRFTRRQIAEVQQMVATFPALSRKELAQTICEHLHWHTPSGGNRVQAALGLLEQLEQAGILRLPPKRTQNMRSGPRQPVVPTRRSRPGCGTSTLSGTITSATVSRWARTCATSCWTGCCISLCFVKNGLDFSD